MKFVFTNSEIIEITNSSLICDNNFFSRENKSIWYLLIRYNQFNRDNDFVKFVISNSDIILLDFNTK